MNFACINVLPKLLDLELRRNELPITQVIKKGNISEEMMIFREYLGNEQSS